MGPVKCVIFFIIVLVTGKQNFLMPLNFSTMETTTTNKTDVKWGFLKNIKKLAHKAVKAIAPIVPGPVAGVAAGVAKAVAPHLPGPVADVANVAANAIAPTAPAANPDGPAATKPNPHAIGDPGSTPDANQATTTGDHICSPWHSEGDVIKGETAGCCTSENPCPYLVGDCNDDTGCAGTLKCNILDNGTHYGYQNPFVDVCGHVCSPASVMTTEITHCCKATNPCPIHVGGCMSDDQCAGQLECNIIDQGQKYNYPDFNVRVCGHKCRPGIGQKGEVQGCCTSANPCPRHLGDCNKDDECEGKLVCDMGEELHQMQGKKYGYTAQEVDVCDFPKL